MAGPPGIAAHCPAKRRKSEVWIYGERVKDITVHPAFRNSARSVARLYDAMHESHDHGPGRRAALTAPTDTGNGGFTHPFFKAPRGADDLRASRDAIVGWQHLAYGFMGRTPDYKAAFLATLGANADFYAPYQDNARRWYARAQERVLYMNHALVHPPIDRNRPADEVADVCVHVESAKSRSSMMTARAPCCLAVAMRLLMAARSFPSRVADGSPAKSRPMVEGVPMMLPSAATTATARWATLTSMATIGHCRNSSRDGGGTRAVVQEASRYQRPRAGSLVTS
jgi:4-hydroxyphenylacetate 3-hydroxylase-like protein